jgi:hypothetical protein
MAAELRDRLDVRVIEACDLLEVEGSSASPYAIVDVAGEKRSTGISYSLPPTWSDELIAFTGVAERESASHHVVVTLLHKDILTATERVLGMAVLDLSTALSSPGIALEEWLQVKKAPSMRDIGADVDLGRVLVRVTYFISNTMEDEDLLEEGGGAYGLEDEDSVDSNLSGGRAPNLLTVTVQGGRNLQHPSSKQNCDTIAVVKCAGRSKSSKKVTRSNFPKWNFECQLPNADPGEKLYIEVYHAGTLSKKFLGKCELSMVEIAQAGTSFTGWSPLLDENGGFDAKGRGEVLLTVSWTYDSFTAKQVAGSGRLLASRYRRREKMTQELQGLVEEFVYDDEIVEDKPSFFGTENMPEEERAEMEADEKAREEMAARQLREYEEKYSAIRPGDYAMQVHIIEARDLKGEDASGTSDPIVYIHCNGVKKHTHKRKGVTSAVFDEVLYFQFQGLKRDELSEAVVQIRVLDANTIMRNELIGSYQFDLLDIYMQPDHEVYRQWVALHDNESKKDQGVQGHLKLSIVVLGPKDRQKIHNLEEEVQEEMANEASAGLGGLVIGGPLLGQQTLNFLVVYVFMAEDLPSFSSVGAPSINAIVGVNFAGNPLIRTTVARVKGRDSLDPTFMQELWLPVMVPPHSKRVDIMVANKDLTGTDTVAHAYFNFDDIPVMDVPEGRGGLLSKGKKKIYPGPPLYWVTLYGSRGSKTQGKFVTLQNKYPSLGTTYRGRLLMAMRIESRPPAKMGNNVVRREMKYPLPSQLIPREQKCTLRVLVLQGSDIPTFRYPNASGIAKMRIQVTLGKHVLDFKLRKNRKGIVEWNQVEEVRSISLPADPRAIPDVCVYLVRATPEARVCYARIKPVGLLQKRFRGDPFWCELQADKSRQGGVGSLGDASFPGSVLLKIGLGKDSVARQVMWDEVQQSGGAGDSATPTTEEGASSDEEDAGMSPKGAGATSLLGKKEPFCLRVHIFQCRNLPSSEASGLLDPYVKCRFMGQKKKTRAEASTTDPTYYETLEFHEMLPKDIKLAPEVRLEVWDRDTISNNTHISGCRFALADAVLTTHVGSRVPTPSWHRLRDTNGQPGMGQILVSLQLIAKGKQHDKLPRPPDITPAFRPAFLEVISLGVRDLKPFDFQGVSNPYIVFEMTAGNERVRFQTASSKTPRGKNANFLERKVMAVMLPEDPLYSPQLTIRVHDSRLGGLNNPIVGTASVNLATKTPWNDTDYRPPQTQSFLNLGGDDSTPPLTPGGTPSEDGSVASDVEGPADTEEGLADAARAMAPDAEVAEQSSSSRPVSGSPDPLKSGGGGGSFSPSFQAERSAQDATFGVGAFQDEDGVELPPIWEDMMESGQTEMDRRKAAMREMVRKKKAEVDRQKSRQGGNWYEKLLSQQARKLGVFDADDDMDCSIEELGIAFPKEWASSEFLEGRDWWMKEEHKEGSELEQYLKHPPFESYDLYLGSEKEKKGLRLSRRRIRKVGAFKGLIVITESQPSKEASDFIDLSVMRKPQMYVVRLYIIKGVRLQPQDYNGLADPYITFKVGKHKLNDKEESLHLKTLEPGFYRSYEFPVTIPGESRLRVKIFDYDRFGSDDLIGQTEIDLEDRWFSSEWRALGASDPRAGLSGPFRPVEMRDLWSPASSISQGQISMWLEILTTNEARRYPMTELKPPPAMSVEIRVICWRSKDVVSMDDFTGLNDLYAKFWLESSPKIKKETDTHWRCKNGKGSWNYRLTFDVDLPLKSPEHGRLGLQLWDRDILKWNDIIAQTSIDLYRWLLMVYHEQQSIKPFKIIREARRKKDEMLRNQLEQGIMPSFAGAEDLLGELNEQEMMTLAELEKEMEQEQASTSSRSNSYDEDGDPAGAEDGDEGDELDIEMGAKQPLLRVPAKSKADQMKDKKSKAGKADDTDELVEQVKEFFGVGKIPEDAQWLKLTKTANGMTEDMGSLLISIEILPKVLADSAPVGAGRSEPNMNPYLPPPTGRLTFSFNPFKMVQQLVGPKIFYRMLGCCCCMFLVVAIALLGNYVTTFSVLFS